MRWTTSSSAADRSPPPQGKWGSGIIFAPRALSRGRMRAGPGAAGPGWRLAAAGFLGNFGKAKRGDSRHGQGEHAGRVARFGGGFVGWRGVGVAAGGAGADHLYGYGAGFDYGDGREPEPRVYGYAQRVCVDGCFHHGGVGHYARWDGRDECGGLWGGQRQCGVCGGGGCAAVPSHRNRRQRCGKGRGLHAAGEPRHALRRRRLRWRNCRGRYALHRHRAGQHTRGR